MRTEMRERVLSVLLAEKDHMQDHVQVESSRCCFPRALVSFVRPGALVSFDQWHVTRSPSIRKRI